MKAATSEQEWMTNSDLCVVAGEVLSLVVMATAKVWCCISVKRLGGALSSEARARLISPTQCWVLLELGQAQKGKQNQWGPNEKLGCNVILVGYN